MHCVTADFMAQAPVDGP